MSNCDSVRDILTLSNGSIAVQLGIRRGAFGAAVVTTGLFPDQPTSYPARNLTLYSGDCNGAGKTDLDSG